MSDLIKRRRTIHLAHGDAGSRTILNAILTSSGHDVRLTTSSGLELIERSVDETIDVIIASPCLSDMDGIEALVRIGELKPTTSVVVARSDDLDKVERAMEDHVMAYLVEPVTIDTIQPAIFLAERRFEHFQAMTLKIKQLEKRLEDRKLIERAKGIVMQFRDITENEAHRYLQSKAARSRQKLVEVARMICEAGGALQLE